MEKNNFLIYNDILYELYSCSNISDLDQHFLLRLRMLIPYSYASILLASTSTDIFHPEPICIPDSFIEAETEYIQHADEDPLLWLIHGKESTLVRESDLVPEERRLHSPLYLHCYQKYNIYDTLQYSIVYQQKFLGIVTLFRTKIDGAFTEEDMFYLRSFGIHLNVVINHLSAESINATSTNTIQELQKTYELTNRETELLKMIFEYKNNQEITELCSIQENTLQKHLQNIFRKMNVSSKWDLLKYKM